MWHLITGNVISFTINNSNFTDSKPSDSPSVAALGIFIQVNNISEITFFRVKVINNLIGISELSLIDGTAGAVSIVAFGGDFKMNMYMVNFISNEYLGRDGGALFFLLIGGSNSYFRRV